MIIKCGHLTNVEDSNGINHYAVIFNLSSGSEKEINEWINKQTYRKIIVDDDMPTEVSIFKYRCVNMRYDSGHAVLTLEKQ